MRNFLMSTSKFESKTISTHRKQFLSKYKITRTHFYSQPTTQSFSFLITEAFHIDVFLIIVEQLEITTSQNTAS